MYFKNFCLYNWYIIKNQIKNPEILLNYTRTIFSFYIYIIKLGRNIRVLFANMGDDGAAHAKEVSFSKRREVMGDWNLGVHRRSQEKTVARSAYTTLNKNITRLHYLIFPIIEFPLQIDWLGSCNLSHTTTCCTTPTVNFITKIARFHFPILFSLTKHSKITIVHLWRDSHSTTISTY